MIWLISNIYLISSLEIIGLSRILKYLFDINKSKIVCYFLIKKIYLYLLFHKICDIQFNYITYLYHHFILHLTHIQCS